MREQTVACEKTAESIAASLHHAVLWASNDPSSERNSPAKKCVLVRLEKKGEHPARKKRRKKRRKRVRKRERKGLLVKRCVREKTEKLCEKRKGMKHS